MTRTTLQRPRVDFVGGAAGSFLTQLARCPSCEGTMSRHMGVCRHCGTTGGADFLLED